MKLENPKANILEQRNELFFLVGETIVTFQRIEYNLTDFLYKLLELNHEKGHLLLMDTMSFSQKVNLVFEVFPSKIENLKYIKNDFDFKTAKKCLSKAELYRNKIVHSFYYLEEDEFKKQKTNIKGKNGLTTKSGIINFHALQECNHQLQKLGFWYLMNNESLNEANLIFDKHNQV
jgi:hypothetical protein